MNKILRILLEVPMGLLKEVFLIIKNRYNGRFTFRVAVSPFSEMTVDKGGSIAFGKDFRQRSGSHIRIRKEAKVIIGHNVSVNHNCMIVSHENIIIGNDVQFSPNVMVYDHDHDFRTIGGVKEMKYNQSPIVIGNNVWIGANSVILRGTTIGDNSVIAAGSVIKGDYPASSLVIQKREDIVKQIKEE